MNRTLVMLVCAITALGVADAYGGHCGLCRRGGCSDPCTASSCAGLAYHHGSCGGCASMGGVVAEGCGQGCGAAQGGCSGVHGCGVVGQGVGAHGYAAISAASIVRQDLIDCGPVASYQVVMQSEFATEIRAVPYTEYREEVRYRTRAISRQVPVEVQDYRTKTVMVPTTETKTVEYSVLVPKHEERQVQVTETVPVWNEVTDNYTVKVPTVEEVPEEYTVRVPQVRDEQFTYTVQVPQAQTIQKTQRVTNAIPVTKTRTVQVCRPVIRTQTVTRDMGHWEMRIEEVAACAVPCASTAGSSGITIGGCGTGTTYINHSECGGCGQATYGYDNCLASGQQTVSSSCGSCGACGSCRARGGCNGCSRAGSIPCGSGCGGASGGCASISGTSVSHGVISGGCSSPVSQTVTRRMWVPNMVTEEVPVVENVTQEEVISYTTYEQQTTEVPYECTVVTYVLEERTGTRKVVDYVNETRTRTRKVIKYSDETRTRTRKELSHKQETRTQTVPYISYSTEKRTKEVSFTIHVPQTEVETFTSTRYDTVQEEVSEEYTVRVPYCAYREEQVQVCRMVPKLVPITINPCQASANPGPVSCGTSLGCAGCSAGAGCSSCGSPTLAPLPGDCSAPSCPCATR
ncbi:MAG: ferredoxin [Pirellulaceae bacterium]|nr:ferredoxin [Pirellulaceae bacterium]